MRPLLDCVTRQILPLVVVCSPIMAADESPVPNELNTHVEEPLISLPEADDSSPFRSISRRRAAARGSNNEQLIQLAESAVDSTRRRLLATNINSPWQMMHGLLALRHEFQVRHNGEITSGLDWISSGPSYEGEPWFEKTPYGGRAHPYSRPWAFEGHANQFLAILSMSALPLDHEFQTPRGPITIAEMVEHAQKTINAKDEPTWTLWALSRYLPPDAAWRNIHGENWSIERLVEIQTAKPLNGTACGGTHGMFALAHARNVYLRSGAQMRGVWLEAEYKIRRQINTVRVQQNRNGMLSSNYFRGREYKQDFNKRMASAGHLLEFLMIALPQDEVNQGWVQRAITATARDLINNRKAEVRCSPLYHAVNALNIYLNRVQPTRRADLASKDKSDSLKPVEDSPKTALKRVPAVRISDSGSAEPKITASMTVESKDETATKDAPATQETPDDTAEKAPSTAEKKSATEPEPSEAAAAATESEQEQESSSADDASDDTDDSAADEESASEESDSDSEVL